VFDGPLMLQYNLSIVGVSQRNMLVMDVNISATRDSELNESPHNHGHITNMCQPEPP